MALTALSTYQLTPDVTYQPVVVDELLPLVRWQAVAGDGLQIVEVTDGNTGSVGWMAADAVALAVNSTSGRAISRSIRR